MTKVTRSFFTIVRCCQLKDSSNKIPVFNVDFSLWRDRELTDSYVNWC